MSQLLVVLPVCAHDLPLALLNLRLAARLDKHCAFPALISAPRGLDVSELEARARAWFASASTYAYDDWRGDPAWPRPQNWAWQSAARHIATLSPALPWFWWEADATPLRKGWLDALAQTYFSAAKPFAGQLLERDELGRQQTTGVAIYPPDVRCYPAAFLARSHPFDSVLAQDIAKETSSLAALIGNYRKPSGRASFHAETAAEAKALATRYALYHGSSDGSLAQLMLGGKAPRLPMPSRPRACYHSGDLGDIIYSLLFARSLAPIDLFLGPDPSVQVREPMTRAKFDWLAPLLRRQPFIRSLAYAPTPPACDHNLNHFRRTWFSGSKRSQCLFQAYAECFNAPALPEDCAWLAADAQPTRPVVINRTARYRDPAFPWRTVATRYANRIAFLGTDEEYREWEREFGQTADHYKVVDAHHMARIIAGASLFVGNQSFPMALALALNVPLIQETSPRTADCIFKRPNAQYSRLGPIEWPDLIDSAARLVTTEPAADGWREIGPQHGATGLGDILALTPLAARLPRALLCLPPALSHYAPLFADLCPIKFTANPPWFRHSEGEGMAASKLRFFGLRDVSPLPIVRLSDSEKVEAQIALGDAPHPLAFVPSCSRTWAHIRERPPSFWEPIARELSTRFTLLQFGRPDYPLINGARRMPWLDVRRLAAHYCVIGAYLGVDTGDYHLAVATGCAAAVLRPESQEGYNRAEWEYADPRITYLPFDAKTVLAHYAKQPLLACS